MSPADLGRRWRAAKALTLAVARATSFAAVLLLAVTVLLVAPPRAASAAGELTLALDRSLTLVNETPGITVTGDAIAAVGTDDTLAVRITGPAAFSQLAQIDPAMPQVGSFVVAVGSLPSVARPAPAVVHLPVPLASLPALPGAYRITVDVISGGHVEATGSAWMGRVAVRTTPLDIAFFWRAALGIHSGPDGRFLDQTLEQACAPGGGDGPAVAGSTADGAQSAGTGAGTGGLAALVALPDKFPGWSFSLGIEPVLLAQLRQMAGGYARTSGSGAAVQVGPADPAAKNASAVLAGLTRLAEKDTIEVAVAPYAIPDLDLLATQGWRDGFEQVQLGKQAVVQTMSLALPPAGAWSTGLDLTTSGLGDFGQASIDHVLVDASVAKDLNEPVADGTVAVRARDDKNDRVTLVLADSQLRTLAGAGWDPGVLFAGIAAELAAGDRDALVLAPGPDFALAPSEYLDAIGAELQKDPWIRTQTMTGLLRAHPPATRPLLLNRSPQPLGGYIRQTIFSEVQLAHAAVADLATIADPASLPLDSARRALYLAESGWWSRPGVSPEEASAGLGYAVQADNTARAELGKITLGGAKSASIFGHQGQVKLVANNGADYAVTVEVRLTGSGLRFPQGNVVKVSLEPGGNAIPVQVVGTSSSRELTATLVAGNSVLSHNTTPLRFVTITEILPWAGLAAGVILVVGLGVVFVRRRKARRPV